MTKTDYYQSDIETYVLTNTKKKDRKSPKHDDDDDDAVDDANVDDDVALRHFFLPFLSFPLCRRLCVESIHIVARIIYSLPY